MRDIRRIVTVAAATLTMAPLALAQPNPTSQQITDQLRPTASSVLRPCVGVDAGCRGIRPITPGEAEGRPSAQTASPETKPRVATSAAPVQAARNPAVSLTVEFATGSAGLTPSAMTTLDELGRALSGDALASYRFRIEGHTDTVGTPDNNKTLSERRADAVAAYIEHKFGISPARLTPVGLGSSQLAVPTAAQVAEPRNRRVQVINLGA
jgi:outer membrane protein OmpA-like peptidoglycan-associated protein